MKNEVMEWLKAALVRAVKTAAQAALGVMTGCMLLGDVSWGVVASAAAFSAIYSLVTSVAGVPEVADGASVAKIAGGE